MNAHHHTFYLTAAGHRLRARWYTPTTTRHSAVIVLLHEGLGCIEFWKDVPDRLAHLTGCRVLAYDRWGYGHSDPLTLPRAGDYLQHEATVALPEVLQACGIERPLLFGHSDGGSIALWYAAAFPQQPLGMVTAAAHVIVEDITLAGIRTALTAYRDTEWRQKLALFHGDKTDLMFRAWAETWLRPEFADWSMTAVLPQIVCPALILQGEQDEYGTPEQVAAIVRGCSGPTEAWLIPDCAHIPHLQQKALVLARLAEFFERCCGPE